MKFHAVCREGMIRAGEGRESMTFHAFCREGRAYQERPKTSCRGICVLLREDLLLWHLRSRSFQVPGWRAGGRGLGGKWKKRGGRL